MYLALVSNEAARVCEPFEFLAAGLEAFIGALVFVHVFAREGGGDVSRKTEGE
jgi:hypothetical protein